MPANFFTIAWPLAYAIILLAGIIVILAAVATLVAAITRARQVAHGLKRQAQQGDDEWDGNDNPFRRVSPSTDYPSGRGSSVVETFTSDGVHYNPIP
jgi:hypothetical protein